MAEFPPRPQVQVEQTAPSKKTAWTQNRFQKDANYYAQFQTKYEKFLRGNKFLTIPETLDTVNKNNLSAGHRGKNSEIN